MFKGWEAQPWDGSRFRGRRERLCVTESYQQSQKQTLQSHRVPHAV